MSGGYSFRGTAHVNRIHREMATARKDFESEQAARAAGSREQARAERERLAQMSAVDREQLVVGAWAVDRRKRLGRIVRVNAKTVTLEDRDLLVWRVGHGDVIAVKEVA